MTYAQWEYDYEQECKEFTITLLTDELREEIEKRRGIYISYKSKAYSTLKSLTKCCNDTLDRYFEKHYESIRIDEIDDIDVSDILNFLDKRSFDVVNNMFTDELTYILVDALKKARLSGYDELSERIKAESRYYPNN